MAGCRMAMKGRPLIKQGYEQELSSIKAFISMQNKSDSGPAVSDYVSVFVLCIVIQWNVHGYIQFIW